MCTGNPPGANVFIMMTKTFGEYAQLDQNQPSTSLPFWSCCDPLWHTNRTLQFEENEEAMQWKSETLKHKCCHFDKIFVTGCTRNLSQWPHSLQPVLNILSKWYHFLYRRGKQPGLAFRSEEFTNHSDLCLMLPASQLQVAISYCHGEQLISPVSPWPDKDTNEISR